MASAYNPPPTPPKESNPTRPAVPKPFSNRNIASIPPAPPRDRSYDCVYGPPPPSLKDLKRDEDFKPDTTSRTKPIKRQTSVPTRNLRKVEPSVYNLPSLDVQNDTNDQNTESHTTLWVVLGIVAVVCICLLIWLL